MITAPSSTVTTLPPHAVANSRMMHGIAPLPGDLHLVVLDFMDLMRQTEPTGRMPKYYELYSNACVLRWFILHETMTARSFDVFIYEWAHAGDTVVRALHDRLRTWPDRAALREFNAAHLYRIEDHPDALVVPAPHGQIMLIGLFGQEPSVSVIDRRDFSWIAPSCPIVVPLSGWEGRTPLTPHQRAMRRLDADASSAVYGRHHGQRRDVVAAVAKKYASLGFEVADEDVVLRRQSICDACEFYDKTSYRCTKCGCSGSKLILRSATCPVGKW